MERLLGLDPARPRGPRRPLPRVPDQRGAGAGGGRGEEGVPAREPGRGPPGPVRRAHGLRPHRRPGPAQSRGSRATGARHRRRSPATSAVVRGRAGAASPTTSTRWPSRPIAADLDRKVELLKQVDAAARGLDPRVHQVIATLGSEDVVVLIAGPSGWTVGDVRPLTRLNVTVIVEDGRQAGDRQLRRRRAGGLRLLPRAGALEALHRARRCARR